MASANQIRSLSAIGNSANKIDVRGHMSWTCDHIRRDSDSDIFQKKCKHLLVRRLSNRLLKFPIIILFFFLQL